VLAHPDNISHITSDRNLITFYFTDRDCLRFFKGLTWLITQLPADNFRLWHKSYIINVLCIEKYKYCGKAIKLLMTNGQIAFISKNHLVDFRPILDLYDHITWDNLI
jgi:hypothetical protein